MNKKLVLLIAVLIVSIGFLSGCNEETGQISVSIIINKFEVSPIYIQYGETANLTWNVTGATNVIIDNNIGTVGLSGTRIIQPTQNTTYTLTAINEENTKIAAAQIIVEDVLEPSIQAPNIAWTVDIANSKLMITLGSSTHRYAASVFDGYLAFKLGSTKYYVNTDFFLTTTIGTFSTASISAGDTITGFTDGTYQIIWEPTDKILGEVTFTGQTAPSLAWSIDDLDDSFTVTSGSSTHTYASATSANLVFKKEGVEYYVDINYDIANSGTMNTNPISAGDIIYFNLAGPGTYQIIWKPTDKLLGSVTFT